MARGLAATLTVAQREGLGQDAVKLRGPGGDGTDHGIVDRMGAHLVQQACDRAVRDGGDRAICFCDKFFKRPGRHIVRESVNVHIDDHEDLRNVAYGRHCNMRSGRKRVKMAVRSWTVRPVGVV